MDDPSPDGTPPVVGASSTIAPSPRSLRAAFILQLPDRRIHRILGPRSPPISRLENILSKAGALDHSDTTLVLSRYAGLA
jgi:hypothetical protein